MDYMCSIVEVPVTGQIGQEVRDGNRTLTSLGSLTNCSIPGLLLLVSKLGLLSKIRVPTGIIPRSALSIPSRIKILPCLTARTAALSTYPSVPPFLISLPCLSSVSPTSRCNEIYSYSELIILYVVSPQKTFHWYVYTPTEGHYKPPCIRPWLRQQKDILPQEEFLQHEV